MPNNYYLCTEQFGWTLEELLEIIDDALCHGFEFIVSNGKLYFKEP